MNQMRRMLGMILLGALGALAFELAAPSIAARFPALERIGTRTTVVNTTQRVTVTGEAAFVEAVGRLRPVVVAVEARRGSEPVAAGSGIILTADGLVVTASSLVPADSEVAVAYRDEVLRATVVRRDETRGLALLKIPGGTLPVAGLMRFDEVRLGERVLAVWVARRGGGASFSVTDGVVSRVRDDGLVVALMPARELPAGAAVAALDGNVVAVVERVAAGDVAVADSRAIEALLVGR